MILDKYNRVHNYLRISLTDNCNLRCFYCMPEEHYEFTPAAQLMQADEIDSLARIFVSMGVTKIRLTGGEPLVRKDAANIIERLSALPVQLTITTNGTRVASFIETFKKAKIKSLNISLDTLQADKFMLLTRRNEFDKVKSNIDLLVQEGFEVKVNMVVMQGINENEILPFVQWTRNSAIEVRFIEFMPFSGNHWKSDKVFTLHQILQKIATEFSFVHLEDAKHATAKHYKVPGHQGTFAIISTMSANFCGECNRIRLTADGKMKNCLFSKNETDLLQALRNGKDIIPLIQQSIQAKEKELGGQFTADFEHLHPEAIHNRSMITIGG